MEENEERGIKARSQWSQIIPIHRSTVWSLYKNAVHYFLLSIAKQDADARVT